MSDLKRSKTLYRRIYPHLPVTLQNAAWSTIGWHNNITCRGRVFRTALEAYERQASWSPLEISAYRDARLRAFVAHAYETVPYYRRTFDEAGLRPDDITGLEDLELLPILPKARVQDGPRDFLSSAVSPRRRKMLSTSGSTGAGLRFATTIESVQEQWATYWRYWRSHGIEYDTWCAVLSDPTVVPLSQDTPPYWRYSIAEREIVFSSYHTSPEILNHYVDELRRKQPRWIFGAPSQIALVASCLLETGADLGYDVRWVTTSSENLLPQQVLLIEKAFGVTPTQQYSMTEAVASISECERNALHVDEEFAAVEFIPMGDDVYKVIGTNYTNLATPLIRYDCQDRVIISSETACSCGRPGRVVSAVQGREQDYMVLKDGTRLCSFPDIFDGDIDVREAQIRQERIGEIVFLVVRGPSYSLTDEHTLRAAIGERIRDGSAIKIEYVDQLKRTQGGKLRFIVSDVSGGVASVEERSRNTV